MRVCPRFFAPLLLASSTLLCLAPRPASAGTWLMHLSLTPGVTPNNTVKAGFKKALSWTMPADATNSVSLGSLASGAGSGPSASITAQAVLSATLTGTWTPDAALASDPAPPGVVVQETSAAYASFTVSGSGGAAGSLQPGSADDGLGQKDVQDASGRVSGTKYTKCAVQAGGTFSLSLAASASASASPGPSGTNPDGTPYSGTCTVSAGIGPISFSIHAQPYNFHQTSATDQGLGNLNFTYEWSSTSGSVSDLGSCFIYEHTTYPGTHGTPSQPIPYQPPSPPFNTDWSSANNTSGMKDPTELPSPKYLATKIGPSYIFGDTNQVIGTFRLPADNVTPVNSSFTSIQTFMFDDTATGQSEVQVPGPATGGSGPYSITRSVNNNPHPVAPYPSPYGYIYTIIKNSTASSQILTP